MPSGLSRKVVELLASNPGLTLSDIAGMLGVDARTARRVLYLLKARGIVERSGNSYYLRQPAPPAERPTGPAARGPPAKQGDELEEVRREIRELRERVEALERRLEKVEAAVLRGRQERRGAALPRPVMSAAEALQALGHKLEEALASGRAVRVGSLVVEGSFFEEFCRRFPMGVEEAERLKGPERLLLEEMRREGMVILQAGRELRLVSRPGTNA
ncbi:MAG: helix-turn-helix domain-containing protein [Desulfurococcaceae archaeon]